MSRGALEVKALELCKQHIAEYQAELKDRWLAERDGIKRDELWNLAQAASELGDQIDARISTVRRESRDDD